jgi:hypothetical protein
MPVMIEQCSLSSLTKFKTLQLQTVNTADVKALEKLQASATLTTFPLLSAIYSLFHNFAWMDGK